MTWAVMLVGLSISIVLIAMGHRLLSDLFSSMEVLETDPVFDKDQYTCPQCDSIWHFMGEEIHHRGCLAYLARSVR